MSQWQASQLSGDSSILPAIDDLLKNVRDLVNQPQLNSETTEKIPYNDNTSQYSTIIESLADMLSRLPVPAQRPEVSQLRLAAELARLSLDAISRIVKRMEGVLAGGERSLMIKLFKCASVLDEWNESDQADLLSFSDLRNTTVIVLSGGLRARFNEMFIPSKRHIDAREETIACLDEIVTVIQDLYSRDLIQYPCQVNLFDDSGRIQESSSIISKIEESMPIGIVTVSHLHSFTTSILTVLSKFLPETRSFAAFDLSIQQGALDCTRLIADSILKTPGGKPSHFLGLFTNIRLLIKGSKYNSKLLQPLVFRVFRVRLEVGQSEDWEALDEPFREIFESTADNSVLSSDSTQLLERLSNEFSIEDNSLKSVIVAFLKHQIPCCSMLSLKTIQEVLTNNELPGAELLRHLISQRTLNAKIETAVTIQEDDLFQAALNFAEINLLQEGSSDSTMKDTGECWQINLLSRLQVFFSRPLPNKTPQSRIQLAQNLSQFPKLLVLSSSIDQNPRTPYILIDLYSLATARLLDGVPAEVTTSVWSAAYGMYAKGLSFHHVDERNTPVSKLDSCFRSLRRGLEHRNREVRIKAGCVFSELVKISQLLGHGHLDRIRIPFSTIKALLDHRKDGIKETAVVTLGLLGRIDDQFLLSDVIKSLVCRLGHTTNVIRSSSYAQLLLICKHHDKVPFKLLSQDMPAIASMVASECINQPLLLTECCRFISSTPEDFLQMSLPFFLPDLVAGCARRELTLISSMLDRSIAALILQASEQVFSHVFILGGPGETERALQFILESLSEVPLNSQKQIGISNLVKSCLVPLLGRLVIELGSEERGKYDKVLLALKKVEECLVERRHGKRASQANTSSAPFLEQHIVGIITYLSDDLQDVHGKRSAQTKRQVLRSFKAIILLMKDSIPLVSPQIMATMQNTIHRPELAECTLITWQSLANTLGPDKFQPYIGVSSAIIVRLWDNFDPASRIIAKRILFWIYSHRKDLSGSLHDVAGFNHIPELKNLHAKFSATRCELSISENLRSLCRRIADLNESVSLMAIADTRAILSDHEVLQPLITGDSFDPSVGLLVKELHSVVGREGDLYEGTRLAAFECLGFLGAIDPDRLDIPSDQDYEEISYSNFEEEQSAQLFAAYLITNVLSGVFRSTSDLKFQAQLAYTLQELLSFCGFNRSLVSSETSSSISIKIRTRWKDLPEHVRVTVTPLLSSKFTFEGKVDLPNEHPVYSAAESYREWIQKFSSYLILKTTGARASAMFIPFRALLRGEDVQVLRHLLPHLVLNLLLSGRQGDIENIRREIVCVLEDQANAPLGQLSNKQLLCAETIFQLMDHLNKFLRHSRMLHVHLKGKNRRQSKGDPLQDRKEVVDHLTSSIDQNLMARAALQCKQYARALMNLEQRVNTLQKAESPNVADIQQYYESMHEIYSHLDEPDGMSGISTRVLSPSLEHQIREHESTGRWTSAQSCWEVRLQQEPDNLDSHIGLLRCLRNLGHFDTLRTHLAGILPRHAEWAQSLEPFRIEGAWTGHDWKAVEDIVKKSTASSPELTTGRLLLALRAKDELVLQHELARARLEFGQPIGAGGYYSYRRTYDSSIHLHIVQELKMIFDSVKSLESEDGMEVNNMNSGLYALFQQLDYRYNSILPSYRTLEPILSIRRTAFDLLNPNLEISNNAVGKYWLLSSKIARKAGHFQAAYSALLQGRERGAAYYFIQGSKLQKSRGNSLRALQELDTALLTTPEEDQSKVIDLTMNDQDRRAKAKAWLLRARWMQESERFSRAQLNAQFRHVTNLYENWEAAYFYWALYLDRSRSHKGISKEGLEEYTIHVTQIVIYYGNSLKHGSKHLYQTVPRMLTLWLNLGERQELLPINGTATGDHPFRAPFKKLGQLCTWLRDNLLKEIDPFKWLTAFPQIVSRLTHPNEMVITSLLHISARVIQEYPQQSLWLLTGMVSSSKKQRKDAGSAAIATALKGQLGSNGVLAPNISTLISRLNAQYLSLSKELLHICTFDPELAEVHLIPVKCPKLAHATLSNIIIPLQDSFTTKIPPMSSQSESTPFPTTLPTIKGFRQEIQIMPSLQHPRKIGIEANNGETYFFLCKPKDDLRKDARLMDFNSVINKLLRANSESRRRQLHIRTYSVVPLNEECGLIEWVRNTNAFRAILKKRYDARGIHMAPRGIQELCEKFKQLQADEVAKQFQDKLLAGFPPLFHEWFLETFPEPTAWLASRLSYSRTAAVISMVGYILGLGDRHGENIMLDESTGETVHCDFNCLFEKGKTLEVPELVPFRLTQNIVDGMGVTGVEGCFRIASEITMELLRLNQDCLMSILEAFIHDPLVEWENEQHRKEKRKDPSGRQLDLRKLAMGALNPIEKKLQGMEIGDKPASVSNQVERLMQEAMSPAKLGKMYVGWSAWL